LTAGQRIGSTPEPMHYWEVNSGMTIAGDSWGDTESPLVLLLHGAGQTRHAWKRTGERLGAAGYFAVAFDARGHGDSAWASDGWYGSDANLADLEGVVAELDHRSPVLVGASMGGGTSLLAIGERHMQASALVLVDVAPRVDPEGVERIHEFMDQKPQGFETLEEVSEAIASYQPHRVRPRNLDGLAKNLRLGKDGKYYWHWDPKSRFNNANREEHATRLERCAASLTLPTLLVRGGLSDLLTEEGAKSFLAICPHSEYVNVTGAAHMVAGDRNDIFGNAVVDFLTRKVPPGKISQ
jgi:pimeloyl-ACP methyl ester carboxylesterase